MGLNEELNDERQWKIEIRLLVSFSIRKEAYRKKNQMALDRYTFKL